MNLSFGKYTLVERLGVGGMAEIFKARLIGPGGFEKYLAVKTILPQVSEDPEFLSLFLKEARLSALLNHTNIVRVNEFDCIPDPQAENQLDTQGHNPRKQDGKQRRKLRWDGTLERIGPLEGAEKRRDRYYLAMEYVDGRDLLSVISRCREMYRPLRVPEVLLIGLEICRGLAYAHGELTPGGHVVIHRDISPQNVLLSKAGEVKITDFGIAKLLSGQHYTNTGRVIGKNTYMSPEQAMCEELDCRSDVFSTGCVLWEMLTCQKLFAVGGDIPVLDEKLVIKPPSTLNKYVPAALDKLVMNALEIDREKRTCSATELGQGLEDVLSTFHGVSRSTDLSGLYSHLFGGDEEIPRTGIDGVGEGILSSAWLGKTKPALPANAKKEAQEPPTIVQQNVIVDDILSLVPRAPDDGQSEVLPAELARPISRGMRRVVVLLLATLVPIVVCASAWQRSPVAPAVQVTSSAGLELLDQVEDDRHQVARGGLEGFEASKGLETNDFKPSEAIWSLIIDTPVGQGASEGVQGESCALRGKWKPFKGNGAGHGWLSINAIPWADVYWNGELLGETPLEMVKMPVGTHQLVLVNNCIGNNKVVELKIKKGFLTKKVVDMLK